MGRLINPRFLAERQIRRCFHSSTESVSIPGCRFPQTNMWKGTATLSGRQLAACCLLSADTMQADVSLGFN